jgi:hypothetical protein
MEKRDREELTADASDFRESLNLRATMALEAGELEAAGLMLVLERFVYVNVNKLNLVLSGKRANPAAVAVPIETAADEDEEIEAAPARPAKPAKCKHPEWDTTKTPPVCKKCGKPKSARGRKNADPAANVATATVEGVTKIDPPSAPLPLGDAAADKFTGGGVGGPEVKK